LQIFIEHKGNAAKVIRIFSLNQVFVNMEGWHTHGIHTNNEFLLTIQVYLICFGRLENLELLQKYGANMWLQHNSHLTDLNSRWEQAMAPLSDQNILDMVLFIFPQIGCQFI
jgi:hypothetical protein